jgi:hypothetical protein
MKRRDSEVNQLRWILFIGVVLILHGVYGQTPQKNTGDPSSLHSVVFRFIPVTPVKTDVFVAGSFNDWSGSRNPMTDADRDGVYEATLFMPVGTYPYKFVVDGQWLTDVQAKAFSNDGQGGRNSILTVDETFPVVQFKKGDGSIMTTDIPFRLNYSMVNPLSDHQIEFSAKAYQDDVATIELVYQAGRDAEKAYWD